MEQRDSSWAGIELDALHRVTDPDQAAIIVEPTKAHYLRPFVGQERTVSDVARELGVSPNALLYRVRRMLDVGLLRVVREVPRAGRAVKVYRSSHDGYLVPMSAMRYDDLRHRVRSQGAQMVDQLSEAYTAVLAGAHHAGARALARNDRGELWSTDLIPARDHRRRPVTFSDMTVQLTREEADEVRALLLRAMDRAREDSEHTEPRETYLLVGALLPV